MKQIGGLPKFGELIDGTIKSLEESDLATITSIRDYAFYGCTNLTSVVIPSNIASIGDYAFYGCEDLTEITMKNTTPVVVTENTFPASIMAIYVEYGAYDAYVSEWSYYADKIVRLPAIPSTITVTVNNYLDEIIRGTEVTITGNDLIFTGTTDETGVFTQGDLQPAIYTISVADLDGFTTPTSQEVVVTENTQNGVAFTYLEQESSPGGESWDGTFSTTFGDNDWAVIAGVSSQISTNNMTSAQVAQTYGWNIGDIKTFVLSTGENVEMRIIGFNHDDLSDGTGKAGITLETTHCLATQYRMIAKDTTEDYADSEMRLVTLPAIKQTLPTECQRIIKTVNKVSNYGDGVATNAVTTANDLFLLAYAEITDYNYDAVEGHMYEGWATKTSASSKIKKYDSDGDGVVDTAVPWLMRTAKSIVEFRNIQPNGSYSTRDGRYAAGTSFAFCI